MQSIDGRPVYAATDLVAFLACEHLTQLERASLAGLVQRPMRDDPELDVIRKRGFEHEKRYLTDLTAEGRTVLTIEPDGSIDDYGDRVRAAAAATIEAMRSGADVIYQATFFDGTWRGHADFLLRVESAARPSVWGSYHYEVADTKLARHVKASAVLQICSYVDQLAAIQGVRPEWLYVALGGSARTVERLRVDDYMAYYRSVRDRFMATMADPEPAAYPPAATYPDPVEHCDVCRWAAECVARRRADDHLSLVAGISARQRRALRVRGIETLEALGELPLPMQPPLDGTSAHALERVREQARLQLEGRRANTHRYELLLPGPGAELEPERGLASLPPPSPGDLFFDIEGDPYALEDGLDYLFGVLETDGTFHAFWSRDDDGEFTLDAEHRAFERLMDFFAERRAADPELHIYHYAPYEPTALKRLMGRYGTREDEVDDMLRRGILVDLLRAVRQGLRASVESYSIKKLEPFYGFTREIDLRDAGSSIVAFEQWLELAEGERPEASHLERIERYNRDDVVSNLRLRDWLETLRIELRAAVGRDVPRPGPRDVEAIAELGEAQQRVQALVDRLADPSTIPVDPAERTAEQHATWLLAQLLGWHRREEKAMWWEFHRLMDLTPDQLVDEDGAIGLLEPVEMLVVTKRGGQTWRYRYPDQEIDIKGGALCDPDLKAADPDAKPGTWTVGERVALDPVAQTVDIKLRLGAGHPRSVVPLDPYRTDDHRARLSEIGEWVAEHGIDAPGPHRAARDLLLGRRPRVGQTDGGSLVRDGEPTLDAARRMALTLDRTVLAIQGPPGSGKTYTGARMICTLIAAGKRVGITSTSHKVIANLLRAVLKAADVDGTTVVALQRTDPETLIHDPRVRQVETSEVPAGLADGANLVAGTGWVFAGDRQRDAVDVLFVDEAGQISLANVVAMSPSTSSIVLLGDPQQLDQPLQGTHPPGAERSALAHVLGDLATMPADRGLFLGTTWRLHPDLCGYTSEVFYDDRLKPEAHLVAQAVRGTDALIVGGAGPRMVTLPTTGADNENVEEAAAVASLVLGLIEGGTTWTDEHGVSRPMTIDDVLVVAPYNAQVAAIKRILPPEARVGTVDKFQGQEAPISIYSLTTSSPELAPRGMDFLYSRHRLNVATSRARGVAIVVGSPDLWRVRARTPAQMRLANAFCRFIELASEDDSDLRADVSPVTRPEYEILTLDLV
ncbi:MAG TPA: TM0106 family RecB-like putative nuclease [Candidatus Limnocylindrales bacterium]|nr:TM0106 family RecB-like putative nuclease [Candidatus Limnocylindrales bacterium]